MIEKINDGHLKVNIRKKIILTTFSTGYILKLIKMRLNVKLRIIILLPFVDIEFLTAHIDMEVSFFAI